MKYPPVDLAYLRSMTDCTGVIQHGFHSVPNRRLGYTTDDNARALIVAADHYGFTGERTDLDLALVYLSYLHHAQQPDFKFQNIMTFQRDFLDDEGTEDCFGRTMWACGFASSSTLPENMRIVARKLFEDSIVWADDLSSPRAKAYSIIGMYEYLRGNEDRCKAREKLEALAESLLAGLETNTEAEWCWYEPYMTYGNAILPLGMLAAGQATEQESYTEAALDTIEFLTDTLIVDGRLEIIGNDGWYVRGRPRAWYDQQSIDAGYTVYLYARAYDWVGRKEFLELAHISNSWFFGNNRSEMPVYDSESKGCYDAIAPWGVNLNQGAESCICYLLAQLAMQEFDGRRASISRVSRASGKSPR